MDAQSNSRGRPGGRADGKRCAICDGELNLLVEVPSHSQPYARDLPATQYFRCVRCNQIQIVDK